MRVRMRSTRVRAAAVGPLLVIVQACSSTTSGHGSQVSGTGSSADFPSSTLASTPDARSNTASVGSTASVAGTASVGSAAPVASTSSRAPYTVQTVGTSSGSTYVARVYDRDVITDCAAHAYGATMIAFLRAHQCGATRRVLATVPYQGRTVVLSAITTTFRGTAQNPYAGTEAFVRLERADGTGSIDDLLRDGHPVAGVASAIPSTEAFQVLAQDDGVTVFDAWWLDGVTTDQDRALLDLEADLFLTRLTAG